MEQLESIEQILIRRDGLSQSEAQGLIEEARADVRHAIKYDATLCELEDLISDLFGLEPDYLEELLEGAL